MGVRALQNAFHDEASAGVFGTGGSFMFALIAITIAPAAAGPWRAEGANTPGWALVTPEERIEHHAIVLGFTNYDDCRAYQIAHHRPMEERAKQRGLPPPSGRRDFCARLRLEWPFAAELFRFGPLRPDNLALTVAAGIVVFAFLDFLKLLRRAKSPNKARPPKFARNRRATCVMRLLTDQL
jgi:hypothetical protein